MKQSRPLFFGALLSSMIITCCSAPGYSSGSTFVDASVYLLYLPSLMSPVGLENLGRSTEVFLEKSFEFFPTPVDDIRVLVSSQTLDGQKEFGDNSTFFVVQTNLKILIQSEPIENPFLFEDKVRTYFTEDWTKLSSMLKLLDPQFFENLKYIDLKPRTVDYFPTIDTTQQESETGLPENILTIYLGLGIGIVFVLSIMIIIFCLARFQSKRGSARETIVSSFGSETSGEIKRSDREIPSRKKENQQILTRTTAVISSATPSKHDEQHQLTPGELGGRNAPSEIFVSDKGTGQIQLIFSKDKVCLTEASHHSSWSTHHSLSVRDLRAQKHLAEDSLRESLRGIIRQTSSQVDLESGEGGKYIANVHRISTPVTEHDSSDHNCPRGQQRRKERSFKNCTHSKKRRQSTERAASQSSKSATVRSKGSRSKDRVMTSSRRSTEVEQSMNPRVDDNKQRSSSPSVVVVSSPRSVASASGEKFVGIISHTNDHDGCSVSTITGSSSVFSAESIPFEVSSDELQAKKKTSTAASSQRTEDEDDTSCTTMSYCIGSEADDFGSIAHSLPSRGPR